MSPATSSIAESNCSRRDETTKAADVFEATGRFFIADFTSSTNVTAKQRFLWQGVSYRIAEILGTDVAARAANVFWCRTLAEMDDVVRGPVEEHADKKFMWTRERFRSASRASRLILGPSPDHRSRTPTEKKPQGTDQSDGSDSAAGDDAIDRNVEKLTHGIDDS